MLTAIIVLIVAPIVLITAFFSIEVLAGLRPLSIARPNGRLPRTAIVVPAHNEESVIAETVLGLIKAGLPNLVVLVVADNCSDGTADAARAAGAEVTIRDEPARRGK